MWQRFPTILLIIANLLVHHSDQRPARLSQFASYGKSFFLVGGGSWENETDQHGRFIDMAGGKGVAKIGVVVAPSGDPDDSFQYYHDLFIKQGALEVNKIPVTVADKSKNSDPSVVALIQQQTGFWFSGGDQSRVVEAYFTDGHVPSPALLAIKDRWQQGAVVGGTSAGTACQSANVMVTGGISWNALRYGASENGKHRDDLTYNKYGGTGFFNNYVLDSHFGNRGREGRLIRLLSDTQHLPHGTSYGLGVDESTALIVTWADTDNAVAEVMGPMGVTFVDVSQSYVDGFDKYFAIRDVYLSYLTNGDKMNLHTRAITFSPAKSPITGHENYDHALTTDDIFYGKSSGSNRKPEFLRVAASVFDARKDRTSHGDTHHRNPTFRVTMSRTGSNAVGYVERKAGFHSDVHSYKNMYVEIMER